VTSNLLPLRSSASHGLSDCEAQPRREWHLSRETGRASIVRGRHAHGCPPRVRGPPVELGYATPSPGRV